MNHRLEQLEPDNPRVIAWIISSAVNSCNHATVSHEQNKRCDCTRFGFNEQRFFSHSNGFILATEIHTENNQLHYSSQFTYIEMFATTALQCKFFISFLLPFATKIWHKLLIKYDLFIDNMYHLPGHK